LSWVEKGVTKFTELVSGMKNALEAVPYIKAVFNPATFENWFHVEAQAIALIRGMKNMGQRITSAELMVNNALCPLCSDLERMSTTLPKGFELSIKDLNGNLLARIVGRGAIRG
jgi:hypothetical protein